MVDPIPQHTDDDSSRHRATSPASQAGYLVESATFRKSPSDPKLTLDQIYAALERVGEVFSSDGNTEAAHRA